LWTLRTISPLLEALTSFLAQFRMVQSLNCTIDLTSAVCRHCTAAQHLFGGL
jgi:hypothetical protein